MQENVDQHSQSLDTLCDAAADAKENLTVNNDSLRRKLAPIKKWTSLTVG